MTNQNLASQSSNRLIIKCVTALTTTPPTPNVAAHEIEAIEGLKVRYFSNDVFTDFFIDNDKHKKDQKSLHINTGQRLLNGRAIFFAHDDFNWQVKTLNRQPKFFFVTTASLTRMAEMDGIKLTRIHS